MRRRVDGVFMISLSSLGSDALTARREAPLDAIDASNQDAGPHGQWQKNPTGASGNRPRIIAGNNMSS